VRGLLVIGQGPPLPRGHLPLTRNPYAGVRIATSPRKRGEVTERTANSFTAPIEKFLSFPRYWPASHPAKPDKGAGLALTIQKLPSFCCRVRFDADVGNGPWREVGGRWLLGRHYHRVGAGSGRSTRLDRGPLSRAAIQPEGSVLLQIRVRIAGCLLDIQLIGALRIGCFRR
jgi:hypothetical protein